MNDYNLYDKKQFNIQPHVLDMPLTERIGKVSVYGSSHSYKEVPYLEEFLRNLQPSCLYLEISTGSLPEGGTPDIQTARKYAEDNRVPVREIGYSFRDVYQKLGRRHPVAIAIDISMHLIIAAADGMTAVQEGTYPANDIRYQLYRKLLVAARSPGEFADTMVYYLFNGTAYLLGEYSLHPELQRKAHAGLRDFLNLSRPELEKIAADVTQGKPWVPVSEEDISSYTEAAKNYETVPELYRELMQEYKSEWLTLTDSTIWKNARGTIRGDPAPAGMVIGFQHFPRITRELREIKRELQ